MSEVRKPREWWFAEFYLENKYNDGSFDAELNPKPNNDRVNDIHVIEKSAYNKAINGLLNASCPMYRTHMQSCNELELTMHHRCSRCGTLVELGIE